VGLFHECGSSTVVLQPLVQVGLSNVKHLGGSSLGTGNAYVEVVNSTGGFMTRLHRLIPIIAFAATMLACGTDSGITARVKSRLAADDTVKAHQIDVTTRDRVVTLSGNVDSAAAKEQALRLARSTEGVRDVVDELRVEVAATGGHRDDVDVDVDRDIEHGVRETGEAIRKGADEAADAARKAGKAVRDAVTDDDRDSDKDGK
jgi:hypothetical protein